MNHIRYIVIQNNQESTSWSLVDIFGGYEVARTTQDNCVKTLVRAALCLNFCMEYEDDRLKEMVSLESYNIIRDAAYNSAAGMFQDVLEDSYKQVSMIKRIVEAGYKENWITELITVLEDFKIYLEEKNISYDKSQT